MNFLKIIKISAVFFGILFSKTAVSENPWVRISSPVTVNLFNCVFTDTLNGWAAGEDGVIIHTSDGGYNWKIQNNPVNYYIHDIYFINKRIGWAVSNEFLNVGSTLLKTTNGGNNWYAEAFPDSTVFLKTIYFLDSLKGFVSGFGGKFYRTTNAGASWTVMKTDSSTFAYFPVVKIRFLTQDTGFACGGIIDIAGVLWKTFDAGNNWSAEVYSPEPFYSMYLKNSNDLFAVGGDFEYGAQIARSSNTGVSWNYQSLEIFGQCMSIDFRTDQEIWMPLGFSGLWAVSYDGGNTWTSEQVTDNFMINSVDFHDSLHGWAVGANGAILKYFGNTSGMNSSGNLIPENAKLYQNYPNPFNPVTKLDFEISKTGFISIKVYDLLGKEISVLMNEKKNPGLYNLEFGNSGLPAGVYFYSLSFDGNVIDTKKMLLIK